MSRLPKALVSVFHDSLSRVTKNPDFMDRFYERFLASSEHARELFKNISMDRVKRLVKQSFHLMLLAGGTRKTSIAKLENLGRDHQARGIGDEDYALWVEALLSVVEETDPQYSSEVDLAWRKVLARGIRVMRRNVPMGLGHQPYWSANRARGMEADFSEEEEED